MRQPTIESYDSHLWEGYGSPIKVIALVGSAGGLDAFVTILSRLPRDFPCPVLVAQHRFERDNGRDMLVEILSRTCPLKVLQAKDADTLQPGKIYVVPAMRHLSLTQSLGVRLDGGGFYGRHVPSADQLFTSMAEQIGAASVAVVLSGSLRDGSIGALKLKACGGRVIVQDPATARFPSMPNAAISTGCADFVLPLERVADALVTLAMVPGGADLFFVPPPAWVPR